MYLVSSHAIRLLPTPGTPVIDTRRGRLSRAVARTRSRSRRNSSSRPTNGASIWSVRPRPPRSATIRMARKAGTGATLPLSTWSPAGSKAMAEFAACSVCSPTRTVPGAATLWRRDAVLTMSPATRPWLVAPTVIAASPVRTPARAWMPGTERADTVDQVERGTDCAFGVVVVRDRRAPDGHHRVADELLDRAAVAADDLLALLEVARQEVADGLGVAALGERREPDEVGEQDRDETPFRDGRGRAWARSGRGRAWAAVGDRGPARSRRTGRPSTSGVPHARAGGGHRRPATADRTARRQGRPRRTWSRSSGTEYSIVRAPRVGRCMTMHERCIVIRPMTTTEVSRRGVRAGRRRRRAWSGSGSSGRPGTSAASSSGCWRGTRTSSWSGWSDAAATTTRSTASTRISRRSTSHVHSELPPADAVFLALPHGAAAELVPDLVAAGTAIIDQGPDFRLRDPADYPRWYGFEHPRPDLLDQAVYGLPELHRAELAALVDAPVAHRRGARLLPDGDAPRPGPAGAGRPHRRPRGRRQERRVGRRARGQGRT